MGQEPLLGGWSPLMVELSGKNIEDQEKKKEKQKNLGLLVKIKQKENYQKER